MSVGSFAPAEATTFLRPEAFSTAVGPIDMIADLNPGSSGSNPQAGVEVGSATLLSLTDGVSGYELWKTDGTAGGTSLVKDIRAGSNNSNPYRFYAYGNKAVFVADDGVNGFEPWITDGTANGTTLLKDIYPGSSSGYPNSGNPNYFIEFDGKVYFAAQDGTNGSELWVSDGTANGTTLLKDIYPGSNSSYPEQLTVVNGKLFFRASDASGTELWVSDGTANGTTMVEDIYPGSGNSSPSYLVAMGNNVYFQGTTASDGAELWVSDGTANGTTMVKDIWTGSSNSSSPQNLVATESKIYFSAQDGTNGNELWVTDGTANGTTLLKDIYPGSSSGYPNSSSPNYLTAIDEKVYFTASDTNGREPWVTDGTTIGTITLGDLYPGPSSSTNFGFFYSFAERHFTKYGDKVFFSAYNSTYGAEPWVTNGTAAGTSLLYDIRSGSSNGFNTNGFETLTRGNGYFHVANGRLFFSADSGSTGWELWSLVSLPTAPRNASVSAQPNSVEISWQAPSFTGASAITSYTAISNPGNFSCTTSTLSCTISGLLSNQDYTFTVYATTAVGNSPTYGPTARIRTPSPQLGSLLASLTAVTDIVSDSSLDPGESVTTLYTGFNANELVLMLMASNPVVIGSANADANGNVAITGIIPSSASAGSHTLALYAPVSGFGAKQSITINAPGSGSASGSGSSSGGSTNVDPNTLPATGAGTNPSVLAFMLLIVGLGLMASQRIVAPLVRNHPRRTR